MREILEDAHQHMDDGIGRAQAHAKKQLRRRFYKETGVLAAEGGFSVTLDNRPTKTPGANMLVVPARELAELMAKEWAAQDTHIDAATMPVVRLVNSAVEGGEGALGALVEEIIKFCGNDLLLFRADSPRELVALQEQHWDGVLVKLARHFEVSFTPVIGIIHRAQPEMTITRLGQSLLGVNFITATALVSITGLTGSGLLALALRAGLINAEAAWAAAHVDENYNANLWGSDTEALARLEHRRSEFDAAIKVLSLVDRN